MKQMLFPLAILGALTATCLASDLLTEDFDDGIAQGWTMVDGTIAMTDGALQVKSRSWADDARAVYHNLAWGDYVFETDIQIVSAAGSSWPASILFHVQNAASGTDNGSYYQLNIGPTLVAFVKVNHSGGQGLVSANRTLTTGAWHHVRIEVKGTTATAFIDGQQVLYYAGFTDFLNGGVGLKAINSAQILYDNVKVSLTLPFQIKVQPQPQIGYWGKSVTFSVTAAGGTPPYTHKWLKNSVPISGTTGAHLVLSDLKDTDAGGYTVTITDAENNSLTSQPPASLTVLPDVGIATYAGLTIKGGVGQTYGIQATTDMTASSWIGVANVTLTQPTLRWYDPNSTADQPKRFYRVVEGPITIP
jgi:hypothetical protein